MRIASTQSAVTAEFETVERGVIQVRQNTVAEEKLLEIYTLLGVNPNPLGSRKSVVHKIPSSKKTMLIVKRLHKGRLQCGLPVFAAWFAVFGTLYCVFFFA
jgi:hypothetical protein